MNNNPHMITNENSFHFQHNDTVVCPFCEHEEPDLWDSVRHQDLQDDHEFDFTCSSCGKKFGVVCHVKTTFSSYVKETDCKECVGSIYCEACGRPERLHANENS